MFGTTAGGAKLSQRLAAKVGLTRSGDILGPFHYPSHRGGRAGRNRCRHRRRRPRKRGRSGYRRLALHHRENGLHHPLLLRHRLRAADAGRRAAPPSRPHGGAERRAARHGLHRLRRRPSWSDHGNFRRATLQYGARAGQRQYGRGRFRAARSRVSAHRQGRRGADALGPHRGGGRSVPTRRPAAGRRHLRTRQ